MRVVPVPLVYLLEILLLTGRAKGPTIFSISQVADCIFNSFVDPASLEVLRRLCLSAAGLVCGPHLRLFGDSQAET
jgi:hypothetical protein